MSKMMYVFLMIQVFMFISGCQQQETTQEFAKTYVTDYVIEEQSIMKKESFYGEIISKDPVTISSSVPGKLQLTPKMNGEEVQKGDILFVLENKDLQAEHSKAQSSVKVANASLEKVRAGSSENEVKALQENVQVAKTKYDMATRNEERITALFESGGISQQQKEQAEAELNIAESQYHSLQYQLDQMKTGPTHETIRVAEAQSQQAQDVSAVVSAKLEELVLKSPISGFITGLKVEEGEFVGVGMPLATVHNIEEVYVQIHIPESSFMTLKQGQDVEVNIQSLKQKFKGTVIELPPHADLQTNLFTAKILIDNDRKQLLPGMSVEVEIPTFKKDHTIAVPIDAVINDKGEDIVYVIEDQKAKRRVIKAGIRTATGIEVVSGLEKGEKLILDGVEFVREGDLVQVVKKESGK